MQKKNSIRALIRQLVNEELSSNNDTATINERGNGYNTFLPGFDPKKEKATIRLDNITEYEEIIQMIKHIDKQVPRFTDHKVVDLQIRNKEFYKDMKKLRKAADLIHQIIDKMHNKAVRGDYLK